MSTSQIYEQHYRRLDASIPLRKHRWIPIAREGLKALVGLRAFLGLMAIAWLPVFGRLVQVYFTTRFPEARRVVPVDDKLFFDFLGQQMPWMLLMSAYAGAGLIANDMRTGGLLLYLSRPLTLGDYILGKASILFASLSMVTLVPGLALFFAARSLAPEVLGAPSHCCWFQRSSPPLWC
jgi:ABC-type transport system involved in multi-copper enzyme maturation permease subunit